MKQAFSVVAAVALLATFGPVAFAEPDTLDSIYRHGVVRIGVKDDYPPFGYRDREEHVGIEIDISRKLAALLHVKLKLTTVSAATRIEKLIAREVDLFIATMSDTIDRRNVIGAIEPNYYASGRNLIARKDFVKSWRDLQDKPVCGNAGAYYNADIARRYGARVVEFQTLDRAKSGLRSGDCIALLYDDAHLRWMVSRPEWEAYELPIDSEDVTPWAIAVRLDDLEAPLGRLLARFVCDLHASGDLLTLEKAYGLRPSRFLLSMAKKYRRQPCDELPTE